MPAKANGIDAPTEDGDPYLVDSCKVSKQPHHYETENGELFKEGVHDPANIEHWTDVSISRKYWIAATDYRHKLVLDIQGADTWLFDLERDPDEFINFVDDPEYRDVVLKFASAVDTYMIENNDTITWH